MNVNEKVETFVVLAVIEGLDMANRITAAFEDIGIPILLEHISLEDNSPAFRVSTHVQFTENATRIVDNMLAASQTAEVMTVRNLASN